MNFGVFGLGGIRYHHDIKVVNKYQENQLSSIMRRPAANGGVTEEHHKLQQQMFDGISQTTERHLHKEKGMGDGEIYHRYISIALPSRECYSKEGGRG